MYTQGKEQQFIVEFFNGKTGTVLDIGANDGKTFSNSLRLIELGWSAFLVEPSPTCVEKIKTLHGHNNNVKICQCAIGTTTEKTKFFESGQLNDPLLNGAENISLVSTLKPEEKKRWDSIKMQWNEYEVQVLSWKDFKNTYGVNSFNFISIDAEGVDFEILQQINFSETETELICIEYNENEELKEKILQYTMQFGFNKIIYKSGENLLICKG